MTTHDTLVTALSTLVSLTGIWVLLCWFYRDYRVDLFRHHLFSLRAELFDHARRGELPFDHPAYVALRTTLNGFLRYAERIGFVSIFLAGRAANASVVESAADGEWAKWELTVNTLEPELRAELLAIRARMHFEVFKQILLSSPLLLLTLIPIVLAALVQLAGQRLVWKVVNPLYKACESTFERVSGPLDAVAFKIGTTA
ncbi:MAG: hypothetical protein JWM95_3269 [Gemmatimonadetes bacterium]|nr:hypothetical protein [Gemmatimonadota bacterium]